MTGESLSVDFTSIAITLAVAFLTATVVYTAITGDIPTTVCEQAGEQFVDVELAPYDNGTVRCKAPNGTVVEVQLALNETAL